MTERMRLMPCGVPWRNTRMLFLAVLALASSARSRCRGDYDEVEGFAVAFLTSMKGRFTGTYLS
jgi:hypothetical protein